jgi:transcriptional regulator with XRE-family HTH domain
VSAYDFDRQYRERIRALREERGWTQEEVANRAQRAGWFNCRMQTVQLLEAGPRRFRLDELRCLSTVFETDLRAGTGFHGRHVILKGACAKAHATAPPGNVES